MKLKIKDFERTYEPDMYVVDVKIRLTKNKLLEFFKKSKNNEVEVDYK